MSFGGSKKKSTQKTSESSSSKAVLGPYPDDNARRMPVANSPSSIAAGRRKRREIVARSGRESTRLAANPGMSSYVNSFLGSVG